jgi:hypothetical protein
VFTARYALIPYIKQIHSAFKGLIYLSTINVLCLSIVTVLINLYRVISVSFIMSRRTAALSHRKPAIPEVSHDPCRAKERDKRNTL